MFEAFWGRHIAREGELPDGLRIMSRDVQQTWFAFDYRVDDQIRIIDEFLAEAELSAGERSFLGAMRKSTMRLYEVTATVPGTSMTLRDLVEETVVTVSERSASKTVPRGECLAARVIPRGCSGRPEMEQGVLHIPSLWRDQVVAAMKERRSEFLRAHAGASVDEFYKLVPPFLHDVWLTSIFEPPVPKLANTDGEEVVVTRVSFHVDDEGALLRALDGAEHEGIDQAGDGTWRWSGKSASGGVVSLATLGLRDGILTVEAMSVERGKRVRELVERLAGAAIRHRGTLH